MTNVYKDMNGRYVPLITLCRKEPEWAASIIERLTDQGEIAGQIASMIDRRVSELLELANNAKTSIEANRFETKANEASNLASQVRRGAWGSENDSRDSAIGRVESER